MARETSGAACSRRFGLVVGADGLHSTVRGLAFGDESRFAHHLGYFVAAADVDKKLGLDDRVLLYNEPGRVAGVYSYLDRATAIFIFWHDMPAAYDYRDSSAQKQMVREAFAGQGWRVPELLDAVTAAPDFYFDPVSQIRMSPWSRGRTVLVGDAAACPALLSGHGTTLAMVGAYLLAGELSAADGDHTVAFARYEQQHRSNVDEGQGKVASGGSQLVPDTRAAIWRRNQLMRLSTLAIAGGPVLRRLPRKQTPLKQYADAPVPRP